MKAQEYLFQISKIDKLIENKIAEMEHWKAVATSTTTFSEGDRVQSSGSKQKMADAVCRYLQMEDEINVAIDRLIDMKQEVISTIEQLPSVDEYDVLHKRYVQQNTLQDVANILGMSYSNITTIHGRALVHLQKILDEREKR
jgi:DNA-directed RNA polymerase specialized sigma subunit